MNCSSKKNGFTIVELLIVIVIIAILAVIALVVYNGVQNRAYDSRRLSEAKSVANAVRTYAVQNNTAKIAGGGVNGNGYGLVGYGNESSGSYSYPTIVEKLNQAGITSLSNSTLSDPQYADTANAYALYQCIDTSGKETSEFVVAFITSKAITPYSTNLTKYKSGSCGTVAKTDIMNLGYNAGVIGTY